MINGNDELMNIKTTIMSQKLDSYTLDNVVDYLDDLDDLGEMIEPVDYLFDCYKAYLISIGEKNPKNLEIKKMRSKLIKLILGDEIDDDFYQEHTIDVSESYLRHLLGDYKNKHVAGYQGDIREPDRDWLIIFALFAGLTLKETNRLLKYAGEHELYPKIKRDSIIILGFKAVKVCQRYGAVEESLADFNQRPLIDKKKV